MNANLRSAARWSEMEESAARHNRRRASLNLFHLIFLPSSAAQAKAWKMCSNSPTTFTLSATASALFGTNVIAMHTNVHIIQI